MTYIKNNITLLYVAGDQDILIFSEYNLNYYFHKIGN